MTGKRPSFRHSHLDSSFFILTKPHKQAKLGDGRKRRARRPVARDEAAATQLKQRTLTNLYNNRPQWLANAHAALDSATAAAYGWPGDISEEDALGELLALNLTGCR